MCWNCVCVQRGSEFVGVPVFAGDSFFAVPAPLKKIEQPQCRSSKPVPSFNMSKRPSSIKSDEKKKKAKTYQISKVRAFRLLRFKIIATDFVE